jgi:hypothetical protein
VETLDDAAGSGAYFANGVQIICHLSFVICHAPASRGANLAAYFNAECSVNFAFTGNVVPIAPQANPARTMEEQRNYGSTEKAGTCVFKH